MSTVLYAGLALALFVTVIAIARELRLRRALERLIQRLLGHLRRMGGGVRERPRDPGSASQRDDPRRPRTKSGGGGSRAS